MSQIILTKKQFEFIREDLTDSESNKKPTFSVSNSETDSDTSSLAKDISTANQHNANANPLSIQTASYTNKTIPSKNNAQVMTIPNGPDAAQKVSKIINTTNIILLAFPFIYLIPSQGFDNHQYQLGFYPLFFLYYIPILTLPFLDNFCNL